MAVLKPWLKFEHYRLYINKRNEEEVEELRPIVEAIDSTMEALLELLDEEGRDLVQNLEDLFLCLMELKTEESFEQGMSLGEFLQRRKRNRVKRKSRCDAEQASSTPFEFTRQ